MIVAALHGDQWLRFSIQIGPWGLRAVMRALAGVALAVAATHAPSSPVLRQLLDVVHQAVQLPLR